MIFQEIDERDGSLGDDGAGPENVDRASSAQRRVVVGRYHSARDDQDVGATELVERRAQRGDEREVSGSETARADDVHVVLHGGLRGLVGRLEKWTDVDGSKPRSANAVAITF